MASARGSCVRVASAQREQWSAQYAAEPVLGYLDCTLNFVVTPQMSACLFGKPPLGRSVLQLESFIWHHRATQAGSFERLPCVAVQCRKYIGTNLHIMMTLMVSLFAFRRLNRIRPRHQ